MRASKLVIFVLLFMVGLPHTMAQKIVTNELQEIFMNASDSSLNFTISRKIQKKQPKLDMSKRYYWYKSGVLSNNKGSYFGFLLHGKYREFDNMKRLREEGEFNYGLKVGIWKTWYESGEVESLVKWKKGLKQGKSYYYDYNGVLQKMIPYDDDVIDGNVIVYIGTHQEKIKYKDGVMIRPKVKPIKTKPIINKTDTTGQYKKKSSFNWKFWKNKKQSDIKAPAIKTDSATLDKNKSKINWKFWQKKKQEEIKAPTTNSNNEKKHFNWKFWQSTKQSESKIQKQ